MTMLLFTNSHELLFCSIVVRVWVGDSAFLEADKQDITKVAFLVQATLSQSSCEDYSHKPGLPTGLIFPFFKE